jgi:hypothetical protein
MLRSGQKVEGEIIPVMVFPGNLHWKEKEFKKYIRGRTPHFGRVALGCIVADFNDETLI